MNMLDGAITAALPEMQRLAESLMLDECVIRYQTGRTTQDPGTGRVAPVMADRLTSCCKIQASGLAATDAEIGGRTATRVRLELHLPVRMGPVETGDIAEITAVGCRTSDPQLVGRKFRIVGPVGKTFQTARRFQIEEVVS